MSSLLAVLLAAQIAAPTKIEVHIMAPGRPVVAEGTRYQGFTFSEYKGLLQMDGELHSARKQISLYSDLQLSWDNLLEQKDGIILTLTEDVETFRGRSNRLYEKWETCEEAHDAIQLMDWLPWTISAVAVVGGAVALGWGMAQ